MKAFVWSSGLVQFGRRTPKGALQIGAGTDHKSSRKLRYCVEGLARHSHNGKLLVPGVPEAPDKTAACDFVILFGRMLDRKLAGLHPFDGVIVPPGIKHLLPPPPKRRKIVAAV